MTSLTERLVGEGTRQDMEYEGELVHNMLVIAQNAIILVARKVKNNVLHDGCASHCASACHVVKPSGPPTTGFA